MAHPFVGALRGASHVASRCRRAAKPLAQAWIRSGPRCRTYANTLASSHAVPPHAHEARHVVAVHRRVVPPDEEFRGSLDEVGRHPHHANTMESSVRLEQDSLPIAVVVEGCIAVGNRELASLDCPVRPLYLVGPAAVTLRACPGMTHRRRTS